MIYTHSRNRVVVIVLVLFLAGGRIDPAIVEEVSAQSQSCQSCHSGYREIGLSIYASQPMTANVENSVRWTASAPWRNVWIEPTMSVDVVGGVADKSELTPWDGQLKGGTSISGWMNITPDSGVEQVSISITLDATAFYDHASSKRPDRQLETVPLEMNVQVDFRVFAATPSLIVLGEGNKSQSRLMNLGTSTLLEVNSSAQRGAVRFTTLYDADGAESTLQFNGTLNPGWGIGVEYLGPAPSSNATKITFTALTDSGSIVETSLSVIPEPVEAQLPDPPLSGSVAVLYGWLAIAALGLIMVQGFSKRGLDRLYKDRYKESRKKGEDWSAELPAERATYWWWLHFALLGGVIAFTIIHIIGFGISDTMPPLSFEIWLGIFAIVAIAIAGYSGLYPKLSKKYLRWFSFRRGHLILAIAGTILAIWHTILLM